MGLKKIHLMLNFIQSINQKEEESVKKQPNVLWVMLGIIISTDIMAFGGEPQAVASAEPDFAAGVRLQAAGGDLLVTYYSAPCVSWDTNTGPVRLDWNEDGKKDLLVGNYNAYGGDDLGRVYYYDNIGAEYDPEFDQSVQLTADGEIIALMGG